MHFNSNKFLSLTQLYLIYVLKSRKNRTLTQKEGLYENL